MRSWLPGGTRTVRDVCGTGSFCPSPTGAGASPIKITAAPVTTPPAVDLKSLRERLGLSPEQFAMRYGFELATLKAWEAAPVTIDTAIRSYLRAIANEPRQVEEAYAPTPSL